MIVSFEKCYICGKMSHFIIKNGAKLLREATCEFCSSSMRNSDTARIVVSTLLHKEAALEECMDELRKFKILEAQASGSINRVLKTSSNYTCFEYFDGVEPGTMHGQVLCNNLESLTFDDNSFDMIISQDVFEHVENPIQAFSEIERVLKNGGKHVFTIPLHQGRKTVYRSSLPPVFHGDPIRESGSLVRIDWGDDIIDIIDAQGMNTFVHKLHIFYADEELTNADLSYDEYLTTPPLMYYHYNSLVLESTKNESRFKDLASKCSEVYRNEVAMSVPDGECNVNPLQLLRFGPDKIIAGENFNTQPNGESALWCETRNAGSNTRLVLNNSLLKSEVSADGALVTAIIPSWLFQFPGEYPLFLSDDKTHKRSNELKFIVDSPNK